MILRFILAYALAILPFQGVGGKAGIGGTAGTGGGASAGTTWSIPHSALVSNAQPQGVARSLTYTTTAAATTIEVAVICEAGGTGASNNVSSITDNATGGSSTWQTAGAGARGSDVTTAVVCETWYSYIKSGATTITVNTAGGNVYVYVYEVNGIKTSAPVDVVGNVTTGVGSGFNNVGASLTTTVSGDFIVGADAP